VELMRDWLAVVALAAASWACVIAAMIGAWAWVARGSLPGLGLVAAGIVGFVALGWWTIQD
jgi:hypothetical protein